MEVELKDDLLMGAKAIAGFLGCNDRQVYHMLAKRQLPGFKIGDVIAARKSSILKHIEELEKQGAK
ncbi:MAG: DNA-binding protein [Brucella anthropi]